MADSSQHPFYYSSVSEIIKIHFVNEQLITNVTTERSEDVSQYVRESDMVNAIRIILYGDDFGFTNPIGSGRRNHKIFALYMDVDNGDRYRTKSEDIPALLICNRKTIKQTSMDEILSPLIKDLLKLEVCLSEIFL